MKVPSSPINFGISLSEKNSKKFLIILRKSSTSDSATATSIQRPLGSLLGSHSTTVTTDRHLHGNFNAHLKKCLFLLGEEVLWGGDRSAEAKLKDMITEPTTICEFKGKDSFQLKSFVRIMLLTNSE